MIGFLYIEFFWLLLYGLISLTTFHVCMKHFVPQIKLQQSLGIVFAMLLILGILGMISIPLWNYLLWS